MRIRLATSLCLAGLGLAAPALRAAESVVPAASQVSDLEARLALANLLSRRPETWPQAADLFRRILRDHPGNADALAGLAEMQVRMDDDEAPATLRTLLQIRPGDANARLALADALASRGLHDEAASVLLRSPDGAPPSASTLARLAELHLAGGNARLAKAHFDQALALDNSPAMQLRADLASVAWGDFNRAEKALRLKLEQQPENPETRDDLGRLLVSADQLEEAGEHYRKWESESPRDPLVLAGLARLALKQKKFPEAAALATRLGWIEREHAAAPEGSRIRQTLHGLPDLVAESRGPQRTSPDDRAAALEQYRRALETFESRTQSGEPPSVTFVMALVGRAAALGDFPLAIDGLSLALRLNPDYFPAQIQRAEFLAIDARFDDALREFAALEAAFPDARQILIGKARAYAWSRRYEEALEVYARLAALNPADPVPRREAARTASWAKERETSAALYATAWSDPVDRLLASRLGPVLPTDSGSELAGKWKSWAAAPAEENEPFAALLRFQEDRVLLDPTLNATARMELDRVLVDVSAEGNLQLAWWRENEAKQAGWDRRFTTAEAEYRHLIALEPGNEEALFDLSQVQAAQGLGRRERTTLSQLTQLDPNHSLAASALERRDIRSRPFAEGELGYWREKGRGELATIERTWASASLQDSFDEQTNLRVTGLIGRDAPLKREGRFAYRGVAIEGDSLIWPRISASAGFRHRQYFDGRIGHTDTGQGQLWWRRNSSALGVGFERREEVTNGFGLFQGIRADDWWIDAFLALGRDLDIELKATVTGYSDANRGRAFLIRPAYAWTDHPRTFKTILTLQHRDTDHASIFGYAGPTLVSLVHPYWTPEDYFGTALTLEWRHDLAREFFVGSQEHWYDLRLTFGFDTESNPSITGEADWRREWRNRWILHAGIYANLSREWDALGARLRLVRRF